MPSTPESSQTLYDFKINDIDGNLLDMEQFRGKVVILANVASECALAGPSYRGFADLLDKYQDQGLKALLFPCNQFMKLEPGDSTCIHNYALRYSTKSVTTEKLNVNGKTAHPMFEWLKEGAPGFLTNKIKWNYTKFLVDRTGNVHPRRFSPFDKPEKMTTNLEKLLAQEPS